MMYSGDNLRLTYRRSKGFTVLEALLAALLLAAGLSVLYSIVHRSVFLQAEINGKEIAALLADETMQRLEVGIEKIPEDKSSISGSFSDNYPNYNWKAILKPLNNNLIEVNLTIYWDINGKDNNYSVASYLYR